MIPARSYRYSLKRGMAGHEVYALQILLNQLTRTKTKLVEDGSFGSATEARVSGLQKTEGIRVDGVAGSETQRRLGLRACKKAESSESIPKGLMAGLMEGESGFQVGCVNWDVPGGVDCGLIQDRVYSGEYSDEGRWHVAFGLDSVLIAAEMLQQVKSRFRKMPGGHTDETAWKLAVLNHNWPSAAQNYASGLTDWNYVARFTYGGHPDDGTFVRSAGDGGEYRRYSMSTKAQWVLDASGGRISTGEVWAQKYVESKITYVKDWH